MTEIAERMAENCHRLYEYAYLVSRVRCHLKEGLTLKNAIDLAIDDCLKEGILEEFLTKHREEATMDLMTELYTVERPGFLRRSMTAQRSIRL